MKILKNKLIISMVLLTLLALMPQVYAKTSIEIKPNSNTIYTNRTISDFFDESIAMKNQGEVLEGSTVDVHMATNTDWAIVSYFSNSPYGTSGVGQNQGTTISVDEKEYYSTNGNITGIMDFGKTTTYTAAVISNYTSILDTSETAEPYDWGKSIIQNVTNNQHVNILGEESEKSMAATAWYGAPKRFKSGGSDTRQVFSVRIGLFGIHAGIGRFWTPRG